MRTLHAISTLLILIGVGFFLFDLIYQFAVHGFSQMKILSIEDVWTDLSKSSYETAKGFGTSLISSNKWDFIVHLPAPAVLLSIAAIFYLPFKILSLMGAGKKHE